MKTRLSPMRIAILYAVLGGLWILFSDKVLMVIVENSETFTRISIIKGWAYVAVTAGLLFWLVRRYAEAYREKERLTANVFERITDAFAALDRDWRYTYVNRKAGEIFNRRPGDLIGKHIWTEFPEGVGQPFHRAYERAMNEQVFVQIEDYYPPYDRWFENRIYPSPDGLSIFFQDITERKKAEKQLRESEERLARIVETVPDGIVILDTAGVITFANKAAERILGLSRSTVTSRRYNDPAWKITAIDGRQLPDDRLPFSKVQRTGQLVFNVEHAIEHPDGTRTLLSINAAPLHDAEGRFNGMVATIIDITERKRAEATLRESEAKFSAFMEFLPGYAYIKDEARRHLFVNRSLEEVLGLAPGAWHGKTLEELLPLQETGRIRAIDENVLQSRQMIQSEEPILIDGKLRTFLSTKFPIFLPFTRVFLGGISLDITERKKLEDDLRKLNDELDKLVKERTAELEGKIAEIERMNRLYIGRELRMIELKEKLKELGDKN